MAKRTAQEEYKSKSSHSILPRHFKTGKLKLPVKLNHGNLRHHPIQQFLNSHSLAAPLFKRNVIIVETEGLVIGILYIILLGVCWKFSIKNILKKYCIET